MSAKLELATTLKRLNNAKKVKVPIVIDTNKSSVRTLLNTLLENELLVTVKSYKTSCIVRVTTKVIDIENLSHTVKIKSRELEAKASSILEGKNGHVLLTTIKGVITHQEAMKHKIGGEILAFITRQ